MKKTNATDVPKIAEDTLVSCHDIRSRSLQLLLFSICLNWKFPHTTALRNSLIWLVRRWFSSFGSSSHYDSNDAFILVHSFKYVVISANISCGCFRSLDITMHNVKCRYTIIVFVYQGLNNTCVVLTNFCKQAFPQVGANKKPQQILICGQFFPPKK